MSERGAPEEQYDVVIVGGRPAGAGLAARLGARGMRVLILDRAGFPSPPDVPSCPVIYASGMKLLDELGIAESRYAAGSLLVRTLAVEFGKYFCASMEMPEAHGRDYVYSIDRAPFDLALWDHLARYPSVTRRARFSFVDLIRDEGGGVIGIEGRAEDGPIVRVRAGWVVGADGRFSAVARRAGARIVEDAADHTSTVYFAEWEGVSSSASGSGPGVLIHATGRGLNVLFFPLPGGRTTICTHARSDRVDVEGDAEAHYLRTLRGIPAVARRIDGKKAVTPLLGMKRVANRYLDAGGRGWVLVGDALHHKDPVDGQGIYDALVEGKALDEALAAWRAGTKTPAEALAFYRERVQAETHPMYLATRERLKRELYEEPPEIVIRTLLRWMLNDPAYQRRFMLFLARAIPPEGWLPPSLIRDAAIRGALGDLRRLYRRDRGQPGGIAGTAG